jgi:hydroxymethylbilane synthase
VQQRQGVSPDVLLRIRFQKRRRPDCFFVGRRVLLRRLFGIQLRGLRPLMVSRLRIGTRGSQLALWQARWVQAAITRLRPDWSAELVIIKTQGDKITDVPLAQVGGKGLFVKEIEEALLDGHVDLAVHSMKDMPAEIPPGLTIGAVPPRENPLDALITSGPESLASLPKGARIGTSSLRRGAQIKHLRPDAVIVALRGNLDTRLRKLESSDLDAIVLAAAGLLRLGLAERIRAYLPADQMLPAVGQGALCIEAREHDPVTRELLGLLDHPETRTAVTAERAFLTTLQGGCQVPLAAHAQLRQDRLHMQGLVADLDGRRILRATAQGAPASAEEIGRGLGKDLLAQGADQILERLRHHAG